MAQWMVWSILAAVLVILELFSGTFYLLMIAIGLAGGALVALTNGSLEVQLIVAAVTGLLATSLLRRSEFGRLSRWRASSNPDMNLDIGQTIDVDRWIVQDSSGTSPTARVMYRGAMWDIVLAEEAITTQAPAPGRFYIHAIQGSRLIVGSRQ
ncbi:MAG: NfeD family protein [Pseudomonadota bacterium]